MTTRRGITCPVKGCKGKTEFVALVPMLDKDKVIEPHTYAVCGVHYREQWAEVYGEAAGGKTYDEYMAARQ